MFGSKKIKELEQENEKLKKENRYLTDRLHEARTVNDETLLNEAGISEIISSVCLHCVNCVRMRVSHKEDMVVREALVCVKNANAMCGDFILSR